MKKTLRRGLTLLLALMMALSVVSVQAFAEGEETGTPETTDPYIYWYNGYDINVSPHFMKNTENNKGGEWTMIFRLDTENYRANNSSYASNETDCAKSGFAAYCSDLDTSLNKSVSYKRINLEDSTYYNDATAAKIRGVLTHGYWPGDWNMSAAVAAANQWLSNQNKTMTVTVTGEDGTASEVEVPAVIRNMTNAEALSATQAAIWNYANSTSGKPYNIVYHYTSSSDYMKYSCDSTTVDKETVSYVDGATADTENNINLFTQYLMAQSAVAPSKILFSNDHFITSSAVFTGTGANDTTYNVTLRFKLSGTIGTKDQLTLTAKLASREVVTKPLTGTDALKPESDGYYTLTFENVTLEEAKAGIVMNVFGYQDVDDFYFYEPKPSDSNTTARSTSQNLVGKAQGQTPVSAEQTIQFEFKTKDAELVKYNGSETVDSADNAVQVEDVYHPLLSGAKFDLYAKVGEDYVLVERGLKTDENGRITVRDLAAEYDYYFKEVSAPDGFACDDDYHQVQWPDGTVAVANCYDLGSLKISKTVSGTPTENHFPFTIQLDYSTAKLANAVALVGTNYETTWTGIGSTCVTEENEALHNSKISFVQSTENENVYTAEVCLKHGETLTLSGIPAGVTYTVTETDSGIYTPNAAVIGGAISGTSTAFFTNSHSTGGSSDSTPETTSVKVNKVWSGDEAADRPGSITVKLMANGEDTGKTLTLSAANKWSGTFRNLDKKENGKTIEYTIVEVSVEGYDSAITGSASRGFTVTNTKTETEEQPTSTETQYTVSAGKTLDGKPVTGFTFQLKDSTGAVVGTASARSGHVTFPALTYTEAGTYTYTLTEVAGSNSNVTYDDSVYTVTVTVTGDEDGALTAACTGLLKNGAAVTGVTFANTYTGDEKFYEDETFELFEDEIPMGNVNHDTDDEILDDMPLTDVPKTGDPSALWAAMAAFSGLGLCGLRWTRKREDA